MPRSTRPGEPLDAMNCWNLESQQARRARSASGLQPIRSRRSQGSKHIGCERAEQTAHHAGYPCGLEPLHRSLAAEDHAASCASGRRHHVLHHLPRLLDLLVHDQQFLGARILLGILQSGCRKNGSAGSQHCGIQATVRPAAHTTVSQACQGPQRTLRTRKRMSSAPTAAPAPVVLGLRNLPRCAALSMACTAPCGARVVAGSPSPGRASELCSCGQAAQLHPLLHSRAHLVQQAGRVVHNDVLHQVQRLGQGGHVVAKAIHHHRHWGEGQGGASGGRRPASRRWLACAAQHSASPPVAEVQQGLCDM